MTLSTTFIVDPDGVAESAAEGNQLRTLREEVGLKQAEVARAARVGLRSVQRYEANGARPLTEELVRVVATLTAAQLLNGNGREAA